MTSAQAMRKALIRSIDEFCERTGTPTTRFGAVRMGDTAFVATLRDGLDVRLSTYTKLTAWLDAHRDDTAPLPAPRRNRERKERAALLAAVSVLRKRAIPKGGKRAKK